METTIDCPVDGRKNVTTATCPQCKSDLSPLINLRGLPERMYTEAETLMANGSIDEAIRKYISALEEEPQNTRFLLGLATAWLSKGLIGEATGCCRQILEIDPGKQEATSLLEKCLNLEAGNRNEKAQTTTRTRIMYYLLVLIPLIALAGGYFLRPEVGSKKSKIPDIQVGIVQISRDFADSCLTNNLAVKVAPSDSTMVITGEVPTEMHRRLADKLLQTCIIGNGLNDRLRIVNELKINEKQLFIQYRIHANDNLTELSKYFLGSPAKWMLLMDYNPELAENPNRLKVGQLLKIPVSEQLIPEN